MRGGKHSELAKPAFPPRAPPFRARSCCMLWKCEYVLVGRWILRCWQCNVTPIYTQVESAELMTHPTYGKTLYISPSTRFPLQPSIHHPIGFTFRTATSSFRLEIPASTRLDGVHISICIPHPCPSHPNIV